MLAFIQNYVNPRLYPWQIPFLLTFLVGWILGGAFLLRWSLRRLAPQPKLTFRNFILICFLAGLAGFALGGIVVFLVTAIAQQTNADLRITAAMCGAAFAVAGAYLTVYAMLDMPLRRVLKVGTPPLAGIFLLTLAVGMSCILPAIGIRREMRQMTECIKNMPLLNRAIVRYETNNGRPPASLEELRDDPGMQSLVEPEWLVCPAHNARLFYFPVRSIPIRTSTQKLRMCDFKANHPRGRNWLYANGVTQQGLEKDFQNILQRPENAEFRKALEAVEK